MEPGRICHVFVLLTHGEELINHVEYLAASNIALVGLSLRCFRFLDLLPQEMRIPRDAFHECGKEHGIKSDEATGISERFECRFQFLYREDPPISLGTVRRGRADGV